MKIFNFKSEQQISECRKHAFAVITISILIFSIYANTFHASWHFDDEQNIEKNARLHLTDLSWQNVKNTFFASTDGSGKLYRPVACLSFAINYYFGKSNVFGYHLTNICIHLISSLFLFLFIYGVLRLPVLEARYGPHAYSIALLSTVLWAVNPIQTQAITYIVQRMASMAAMFYIMAMYFYLRARTSYQRYSRFAWFFLCLTSGIFAFGSKENAAMLPFSLFLFDFLLIQGSVKRNIKKNAIVLAFLILVPAALVLLLKGPSFFFNPSRLISGYEHRGFTLGQRLLTEPRIVVYYMSLLFYPMPNRLCITHMISPSHGLLHPPTTLLSILLILFLLSMAVAKSKKWPLISFCVVFFFLNHVIESTVFPLELVFEHRNYLPSMLFFVPVSILLIRSIEIFSGKPGMQFALSTFVVVIIIGFGNSTFVRNFTWKTEESLWIDAVDKYPDSVRAHHNLGRYYSNIGQSNKAISEYLAALALKPETYGETAYLTRYNLGLEYMTIGKDKKAIEEFQKAINLFPRFADAYSDLAVIKTKEGDYEEAYKDLITSLTYNRESPQAHNNLGYVLIKKKDYKNAIIELEKALKLKKDQVTLRNLGIAYKHEKDFQKALYFFRAAITKNPKDILARLHLADTYAFMAKPKIAERVISNTIDLIGPRKVYPMFMKFLRGNSLEEFSRRSVVVSLLQKAYADRGESLERMGKELATTSGNHPNN